MTPNALTMTRNSALLNWVGDMARLTRAGHVVWCDGLADEWRQLVAVASGAGIELPLGVSAHRGRLLGSADAGDLGSTAFVCTPTKAAAGPVKNWLSPIKAYERLTRWLGGSMRGRTMYVVPHLVQGTGSSVPEVVVDLTDSLYAVMNLHMSSRVGKAVLELLGNSADFERGLHVLHDSHPGRCQVYRFPQDHLTYSVALELTAMAAASP